MPKLFLYLMLSLSFWGCRTITYPKSYIVRYPQMGIVSFTLENVQGSISALATHYFIQEISNVQKGIQLRELGDLESVLKAINRETLDLDALKAIGEHFGVFAIFIGSVTASDFKPISYIYAYPGLTAKLKISISARLLSTETGETLWRKSVNAPKTFGRNGMPMIEQTNVPYFVERDADKRYGEFVRKLIRKLVRGFRLIKPIYIL